MVKDPTSWSADVAVRVSAGDMWDLMWRQQPDAAWLGREAAVDLRNGARWVLADDGGIWRSARVIRIVPGVRVTLAVESRDAWRVDRETIVVIRITPDPNAVGVGCVIAIAESNLPIGRQSEVDRFWRACLERLSRLAGRVHARRKSVRQAVIVFHGIGEQQPGETLQALADSGVLSSVDGPTRSWVKPDFFTDLYDIRRLTIEASETQPTTDVFECYWAHLVRDTTLQQVAAWLQHLLLRRPPPQPIRTWWFLAWVVAVVAVIIWVAVSVIGASATSTDTRIVTWILVAPWVGAGATLLWRAVGQAVALDYLGDAARYLRPHPSNIAHRQAIREAGVSLLDKLHASGRYDRIVLVGHSLGSVIAYDIIAHAWTRMNAVHQEPARPSFKELIAVERAVADVDDINTIQDRQHAAWRRLRLNTQPWLVTDLVTLGSPLTYADFLLASDATGYDRRKRERLLPTCPPEPEADPVSGHARITYDAGYHEPVTRTSKTFVALNHGAPFAVTRWTNLYFPPRAGGLAGDIIGGPIAPMLGRWVKDVPLKAKGWGSTHTHYWRPRPPATEHLVALRDALRLGSRNELLELVRELPASMLLASPERRAGARNRLRQ